MAEEPKKYNPQYSIQRAQYVIPQEWALVVNENEAYYWTTRMERVKLIREGVS